MTGGPATRARSERPSVRRLALLLAILLGSSAFVWWWAALPVTSPVGASGYAVVDARTLRVSATTAPECTAALDRLVETPRDVTIGLVKTCRFRFPGPGTADARVSWVVVPLAAPVDGRTVLREDGSIVPMRADASP